MSGKNERCCSVDGAMKAVKITGMVLLGIAACFLFGLVVQLLWNWLMPMIFGLMKLTYWQAVGVLALSCILFGRVGGSSGDNKKEKHGGSIRKEIRDEIAKEIKKEFGKKEAGAANSNYDELYEKWWEEQGRDSFEKYSKDSGEDK